LCTAGDSGSLAEAINSLISSDSSLSKAKAAARTAGDERYNWEYEKERLIKSVQRSLADL
jgi:glycosyltransferase involved in cell wall biosynthesis